MANLTSRVKSRLSTQTLAKRLGQRFASQQQTVAGTVIGRNLVAVNGRMLHAGGIDDAAPGTPVALTNVGSPGMAQYTAGGGLAVQFVSGGGSGDGGGGVTDHGQLSGLGDDDHAQYLTAGRGNALYVPLARKVLGGAGLTQTGDGSLSVDVTLAVGAGAGLTVNANDVALTTPGSLTVSSANSATGSHTHAITSSSNVATSPAAALLASTAGGGLSLKTLDIGTVDETIANNLNFIGHAVISTARSAWLLLDSDNNATDDWSNPGSSFAIGHNGANAATAATMFEFIEPGRLNIGPAMVLSGRNDVAAEPDIRFVGNGLIAAEGSVYINIDSDNSVGEESSALFVRKNAATSTGGTQLMSLNESGYLTVLTGVRVPLLDTASGVDLTVAPDDSLILTPGSNMVVLSDGKSIRTNTYTSGFTGSGFRLDQGITTAARTHFEIDDMTVRGRLSVYELLIRQIRATNGSVIISSAAKAKTVVSQGGDNYRITTDSETPHGFLADDKLRAQRFTGSGVYQCDLTVTLWVNSFTFDVDVVSGSIPPDVGMEFVRIGSSSNTNRQGSVYLTADDTNAPYIDVVDGITSHAQWNTPGKVKVRLGKLTGITDTAGEYGLIAGPAFTTPINPLTDQYVKVSNLGVALNNVPLTIYNGSGVQTVNIDQNGTNVWFGLGSSDKRLYWNGTKLSFIEGYIGTEAAGWSINSSTISSTNMRMVAAPASNNARLELGNYNGAAGSYAAGVAGGALGATNIAFWAGDVYGSRATAPFRVQMNGILNATGAIISGDLTALTGYIGGNDTSAWKIEAGLISSANIKIYSGATSVARIELGGLAGTPDVAAGIFAGTSVTNTVAFWAGKAFADRATAPFRAYMDGRLVATKGTFGLGSTSGQTLVDDTGLYVVAPDANWTLSYGYKFRTSVASGDDLVSGLTVNYTAANNIGMALWNNTTNNATTAEVAGIDANLYIKNVASGAGKTANIEINSYQVGGAGVAGIKVESTTTTKRITFTADVANGLQVVGGHRVWHAGNDGHTGDGSTPNADTVDNLHASAFSLTSHTHSTYAALAGATFTGAVVHGDSIAISANPTQTELNRYFDIGMWQDSTGDAPRPPAGYVRLYVQRQTANGPLRLMARFYGSGTGVKTVAVATEPP
jgi:hypothetical protein